MKKVIFFFFIIPITLFAQSKFAIEAGGGIDLVTESNYESNFDNGYSVMISPIFKLNETISFMAAFAFHRVEGSRYYGGVVPAIFPNYSIDNPYKPNIKTYDFSIGMRANFSEKKITPYFVMKTGFLFTDIPRYSYYYDLNPHPVPLNPFRKDEQRIAYYFSPGLGVNFRIHSNFNILLESRFMITTGTEYSYIPMTAGVVYYF